jgi:hypothetical protein
MGTLLAFLISSQGKDDGRTFNLFPSASPKTNTDPRSCNRGGKLTLMKKLHVCVLSFVVFFLFVAAPLTHGAGFTAGDLFIASSVTDQVRYYDSGTLGFKDAFTHELFAYAVPNIPDSYRYGPNGMAFNHRGNLVVATYTHFVEFNSPGEEYARYEKSSAESNENIIFDRLGNMYSTTSTGGSDLLNQYRGIDYSFAQTIDLPEGAGELSGITFDDQNRFYIMSQADRMIHVLQANQDYSSFSFDHSIPVGDVSGLLEGLQCTNNGELLAAIGDIIRYDPATGSVLGTFDAVPDNDAVPVSITIDSLDRIYVADFQNGVGSKGADIFMFNPDGTLSTYTTDPNLRGPFGLAIAGTNLPGGPTQTPVPPTVLLLGSAVVGLLGLKRGFNRKSA